MPQLSPVTSWASTVNTWNLVKETDQAPVYDSAGFNSNPAAVFNGEGPGNYNYLRFKNGPNYDATVQHTFIFVVSPLATGATEPYQTLLDCSDSSFGIYMTGSTTDTLAVKSNRVKKDIGTASFAPHVEVWTFDGTNVKLFINGTFQGAVEYTPTVLQYAWVIGREQYSSDCYLWAGIGEILHYTRVLNANEIDGITNFIKSKWGIA